MRASSSQSTEVIAIQSSIEAALQREKARLKAVYHLVDSALLSDNSYQSWIRKLEQAEVSCLSPASLYWH